MARQESISATHFQISASMNKSEWKERIEKSCRDAGTYREYFDSIIDTLAETMEMRDDARQKYYQSGGNSVVTHTNQGGNANIVKNPMLVVIDDLNKTALSYWRDLGLTPAGLKRINEDALKGNHGNQTLSDVLNELGV